MGDESTLEPGAVVPEPKKRFPTFELPANAQDVGNHHWPDISNFFAEHGARPFGRPDHHSHPGANEEALRLLHGQADYDRAWHDKYANFHVPTEEPGCRLNAIEITP